MPDIDVSDLCDDSDIAGEAFSVVHRREVVGNNGVATTITSFSRAAGSVTPTADNSLVRAEAYSTQSATALIITRARLRGVGKDAFGNKFQADIILTDDGNAWEVSSLDNWTSFGGGFVAAECTSIDYNPMAPA